MRLSEFIKACPFEVVNLGEEDINSVLKEDSDIAEASKVWGNDADVHANDSWGQDTVSDANDAWGNDATESSNNAWGTDATASSNDAWGNDIDKNANDAWGQDVEPNYKAWGPELTKPYCCDLLSIAMGKAPADSVWVTVMGNINTVAVASLADVGCIILAEGSSLDDNALKKAQLENITVLKTKEPVFETALLSAKLIGYK